MDLTASRSRLKNRLKTYVAAPLFRVGSALRDRRRSLRAYEDRLAFLRFYEQLPSKEDIYYIFFTSGLLHWLVKSHGFVPQTENIVLIGSHLTDEEELWVKRHLPRPFHHIQRHVADDTAWEFLFEANQRHFGWLDVDCFVMNPLIFRDMARIDSDVALNCCWSQSYPGGLTMLNTYLLFVNHDVVREIRQRMPTISPRAYDYYGTLYCRKHKEKFYRQMLSRADLALLRQVLPADGREHPLLHYLDTMRFYQLAAASRGKRLHKVRDLTPGFGGNAGQYCSAELIHVGMVSYYKEWFVRKPIPSDQGWSIIPQIEYLLLSELADHLPPLYAAMRAELGEILANRDGKHPDGMRKSVREFAIQTGVPEQVFSGPSWSFLNDPTGADAFGVGPARPAGANACRAT